MDEDVLAATVGLNEAEASLIIVEFPAQNCELSGSQEIFPLNRHTVGGVIGALPIGRG
jgi:hypothetical protein